MMGRRTLLVRLTQVLGGVFTMLLAVPGVAYVVGHGRRPDDTQNGFRRVGRLSELPEPAAGQTPVPRQVAIRGARRSGAWVDTNDVVGHVWLVRREGHDIRAFSNFCPHLGCAIHYDPAREQFLCPCHSSTFGLDGARAAGPTPDAKNPAPRGLDELAVNLVPIPDRDDYHVLVKYETFVQGRAEKVRKG